MPDTRSHRGAAPKDERRFGPRAWPALRAAAADLCWLLNRGYATPSAIELVGNRYELTRRQRIAVSRCVCSDADLRERERRRIEPPQLRGHELWLDGYNVLTAIESALAGGVILLGRDGCCRDLASIHARYRKVEETIPGLKLVGEMIAEWGAGPCRWWLDRPVSNSGRLMQVILEVAADAGWDWVVELVYNPDKVLSETEQAVATSDSVILDRCHQWINLVRLVIARRIPESWLVDFFPQRESGSG